MKFTNSLFALAASVGFAAASPTGDDPKHNGNQKLTTICRDYPTCSAVYHTKTKTYEEPSTHYYTTTVYKHKTETKEVPTTVYSTHEDVKTEYYTDYKTTTIKASLSRVHHFRGYANQNTKQVPEVIHTQTRVCYDKDIDVTTYKEEESKYPVTNSKVHTETETKEYPTQYHSTYTTEAPHPEKTSKVEHVTKYHTYVKTEKQCKQEQKCWTKKQRKDW